MRDGANATASALPLSSTIPSALQSDNGVMLPFALLWHFNHQLFRPSILAANFNEAAVKRLSRVYQDYMERPAQAQDVSKVLSNQAIYIIGMSPTHG